MTPKEKLQLLQLAYLIQENLPNMKENTEDDLFLMETAKKVFDSLDCLSEAFSKAIQTFPTKNLYQLNNKPSINLNNTEAIDATIGVGLYISGEIMEQNKVDHVLEQQQIHEFNDMMSNVEIDCEGF